MTEDVRMVDAVGMAQLVRRGDATPLELVTDAIARIERINPILNAVTRPLFDEARRAAAAVPRDAPLAGVPFLLKDLIAEQAGVPLTEGSDYLGNELVPERDSELVTRFRRAGLVVLGATSTPEFGILCTTEPRRFGACHNPWDIGRSTGGSSGGSAAAVASRMVAAAHANDGGGSIRIPASCCGLFGLKPTRGRISLAPVYGDVFTGLVTEHVVTVSVRDSAAILDAIAGAAPGDPFIIAPPERPYFAEVGGPCRPLRIGFSTRTPSGREVHGDCVDAIRRTVELLEELDHEVEEAVPSFDAAAMGRAFALLWSAGVAWTLDHWGRRLGRNPREADVEPLTWELAARGRAVSAAEYLMAVEDLQSESRMIAAFFESRDLWLTPTLAEPPLRLGELTSPEDDVSAPVRRMGRFSPFTHLANLTGLPAMSVPLHWNSEGIPIGLHFMGAMGAEGTLFRLAGQLEQACPWVGRLPPVHA
ncbi:MAG TPA: amidase [Candidatus Dormibacteraeota bacterium]|nr:amidase [Candidatus Dormibacteraeota bacterium]